MYNQTPLLIAAYKGHEGIVRLLLEYGADKEVGRTVESSTLSLLAPAFICMK